MMDKDFYGTYCFGKYNLTFAGMIYDRDHDKTYTMMIVDEFDENDKPIGYQKTFYALFSDDFYEDNIKKINEDDIELLVKKPNFSKVYFSTITQMIIGII